MKKHLLLNQLFGTEGSPNQTGETLTPSDERAMTERKPRDEKEQLSPSCLSLASYLPLTCPLYLRRVAMIFAVLVMSIANIGTAWGEDITIVPDLSQAYVVDGIDYYCGLFSINHTGASMSSSAITATSKGGTYTVTFATTKSDMYIKSITFNTVSNGTLSSDDGTITSSVFTTSGSKNSVTITMESNDGKKGSAKITNVVVNTGSNEVETITFTGGGSTTTATYTAKKNGSSVTSAISSITSNANFGYSSSVLSISSSKTMTFTSSSNIVFVAMHTDAKGKFIKSGSDGSGTNTYWSGSASSVTFKNTDSGSRSIYKAYVITEAAGSGWGIASSANSYTPASDEMSGSGTVTKTLSLSAGTDLQFKIVDISGNVWYGNGEVWGGTKTQSVSSTGTDSNCHLLTTETGNYTFSFNTSTKDLTITYPNSYTFYYANTGSWNKVYVYKFTQNGSEGKNANWPGVEIAAKTYTCGGTDYYATTSDGYAKLIFTNNGGGDSNQTSDMTVSSSDAGKYTSGNKGAGTTTWNTFPTYTVTYNANGDGAGNATGTTGSVPTDSYSPYSCGSTVTVLGKNTLAKSGYNFTGWNTAPGGGGTSYAVDATFTISANTTLYAQWELIPTYSVTYNANGASGSVPTDGTAYLEGASVTVRGKNTLTYTNRVFAGWNTADDGSGTWYDPSATFSMGAANVTLYAQWAQCISGEKDLARYDKDSRKNASQASSDLKSTYNILNVLGGSTRYDNSTDYTGLKFKNSGDWIGFGVPANYTVTITTQTTSSNHGVSIDFASADKLSASDDNLYEAAGSDRYFRIKTTADNVVVINKITITPACYDAELAYGTGTVTKTYGDGAFTNALTNSHSVAVSYSSSNTDVATVNVSTGEVTIKSAGTTTITATAAAQTISTVDYCADEASYTLNVKPTVSVGPTAIAGNYGYRYSIGETIKLTATPGGASSYSYQWQKYEGDTWVNLSDGGNISGVTTANLQISSCTTPNVGSYRCQVTAGGVANESDGYRVRVYTLHGDYHGGTLTDHAITWTGEYTGTVTLNLEAKRTYTFKVTDNDGKWYGSGRDNYIIQPVSMDCGTSASNVNLRLFTTAAGAYTVTVNIENAQIGNGTDRVNISVAYPSVTHPNNGYVYLTKYAWRPYLHYWYNDANVLTEASGDPQLGEDQYTTICGNEYWCIPVIDYYCNFIARDNPTSPSNTTGNQHTNDLHPGQNIYHDGSWNWQNIKKTISFDANKGSGSMDAVTDICPGSTADLPANTFTRTGWTFAGWNTDKYGAGTAYADEATTGAITANTTLYAQWERTIYFYSTTSNWYDDGAVTQLHAWDGSDDTKNLYITMVRADVCHSPIVYKATISAGGYNKLQFKRLKSDESESWNETVDLDFNDTYNMYKLTNMSGGEGNKAYGVFDASYAVPTFAISYATGSTTATGGAAISGSKANESKTCGEDFTLPSSAVFTATGYTQVGWTTSDGGEQTHALGDAYTTNAAQTFYPVWEADEDDDELTALVSGTLYKVEDMVPSGTVFGEDDVYKEGLSANTKFFLVGSASSSTTVKFNNKEGNQKTIDKIAFTNSCWFGGAATVTSKVPTTKAIKFILPSAGSLTMYYYDNNTGAGKIALAPDGEDACWTSENKAAEKKNKTGLAAGTYYLYATAGSTAIYGLQFDAAVACTAAPTVTAGSNTSVGSTTATVSCESGISSLGTGGCTITSYGFVIGTSTNPEIDGEGVTRHQVGTSIAASTSFSKDLTGLTAETTYYVRPYATNGYGTAYGTQTSFTTTAAATYTVTYNAQGGSVTPSSETVSTATLPTPTKSGYTFDGWYTSGGSKITGTYNPTADITLYAQWQSTDCDAGGTTTLADINFKDAKWSGETFSQGNTDDEDIINGVYFWCKHATKHFSLEDNTSNGLTFPDDNMSSDNRYFCIPITRINSSNKQITVTLKHGYSNAIASFKYYYKDGRTEWVDASAGSGTSVSDAQKSDTEITFTLNNSGKGLSNTAGHLFIGRSSSSYKNIYGVTVTTPGAAGTCYYVTYNGNGATGGYTTDEAAYASGDEATAATNSFTKTGYTFGGWATSKANADIGTKTYDEGDAISITGNITLYAIWQAADYTLAWNTNGGSALSGDYSSGSLADGATITAPNDPTRANYTFDSWNTARDGTGNAFTGTMPAANTTYYAVWKNTLTLKRGSQGSESDKSPTVFLDGSSLNGFSAHKAAGYTLQGYYTAATGGTKVLNADGSFAASNIARFVTSGKWSRTTGDTILVAQWESSYLLKWNLQLNKAEDAISTTSKESTTARITTASMTNLTNNGNLTITGSKETDLTSQIETPINLSSAESKYMSVSFNVTAGYQLLPSAVKVMVQPVGDGEDKYAKLILEDENNSINTVVECEGTEKGKKTTVTLSNAGRTVFTGTVTLKILVYNKSGEGTPNNCYRLGSPIQIDGAIEAACDLPSYEGLEYDQTEYTVGDLASAIRVTGGSANTYQWKWNSTNDRSTGTEVGTNASYTPLTTIAEVGTRYYWCELKNDDCEGVVKTPAVAVTVSSAVTATTVTWTEPENEPNYGGGGYVIRATVDQTEWGGTLGESNLVAPAGIHITRVATGTDGGKRYIEATFDVTTAFNRDENEVIVFGLTHDAVTGYSAISVTDTIDYDACSGGEDGSAAIALTSAIHDEGSGNAPRYWFETSGVGRVFGLNYGKATLSTSSDDAFDAEGYSYVASSTSQRWVFQPYVEGVTKIRIYIKSATNTLRVLSIGKSASWNDQSGKYSNLAVDTIIYSNGKTTGLDNNQKGYAEIQFSSALTKNNYYMITMSSSSTYIYGITLYSESVGDGGNLATSLTFADPGPIEADASTANFQNIASKSGENRNTLGTITYSSNNDAATVNATTGEVSIHAKETAQVVTITATLSASGCYQGATATYTINVAADACGEPSGSIELTTGSATKCESKSVILTMTGFTSGATVEWYNGDTKVNGESGYTIVTSGSTSTLETSNAGTYSAIAKVDGGCASGAGRTNSITISNIAVDASATKIVDKWYVKNGRRTPDIALWQLGEGATLKEVTIVRNVSGEGTLGLTSSDFVARDGIVYLSGKEPSANETGADIEYTLKLTVKDACDGEHEMTEKTITLTHQKNTDKHVLAFVVNGTEKGDWTAGVTAAQTTTVGLYNEIAANFDVLATNIYSTDNEQKLKEYYSQFDILCITDYPNTQTKGANSKSYVDAIGSLIDIRPILTMEAFVSKLENWKVKGISGNPKSPSTRQYTMLLQCKDHEIFAGTELTTIGEGDETMYRVSMVDSTKEDYATLDATYGATLPHKEKESKKGAGDAEYNYGGKPALQGFTFTAEMANDLLPIGLIDDGAGNDLQVGIERQKNMEARLMVLGINSYAMERLTDDGKRVVINALKYLMKKNAEDISDCSTYFNNGGGDNQWNNPDNWSGKTLPEKTQKVRILARCEIPSGVKAHVAGVVIAPHDGGMINHGADEADGSLTIEAGGALIVDGKVEAATAPNYFITRATTKTDLVIGSDAVLGNGTLIFDNSNGETQATVEYYTKSTTDENTTWNWQYMAVPFNDNSSAHRNYYDSYLYRWKEDCTGWEAVLNRGEVYPWVGYCITQVGTNTYTMDGTLVETGEQVFTIPGDKALVLGNSWSAPIQVKQLTDDDFVNLRENVYLFNTGNDSTKTGAFDGGRYAPGTYVTIPIHSATYTGDSMVSSLQAFIVYTAGTSDGTLTLDYDRHVRPARSTDKVNAGPMHAPRRGASISEEPAVLKIYASGSRYDDRLVVLERGDFSTGLDDGWDGDKRISGNVSPHLYAETDNGKESVSAIPDMEGTLLGFRAGEDNAYTLHFNYSENEALYLLDLENNIYTPVNNESSYTFVTSDKSEHTRFILTRMAPGIATGVTDLDADAPKVQKVIYNDKLYIIRGGKAYSAEGQLVK